MRQTLGSQFAQRRTNGFDYLRVALALAVIFWHTVAVSYGKSADRFILDTIYLPLVRSVLPVFFALSGFLVASSLDRLPKLSLFIAARLLRIFPALILEVALSALVLGPLVTSLPLSQYFTGSTFYSYLLNVFGWVHFLLPGVFETHPDPGMVNRSLWTVPSELECYILLSILFAVGVFRSSRLMVAALIASLVLAVILVDPAKDAVSTVVRARFLPLSFLAGVVTWKLRDYLPAGIVPACLATVATIVAMWFPWTVPLGCVLGGYVAAAWGCLDIKRNTILASGDYSYGMYLYAYPIQQTMVLLFGPSRPWITLLGALLVIPAFAALSWHAVEKHVLRLKARIQVDRKKPIPDHEPQQSGRSEAS